MLHTRFPRPESAYSIVCDQFAHIPLRLAEAFRRAPIAFVALMVIVVVMPVVSANGIAGGFSLPLWFALPCGMLGVALQIDSYIKMRLRKGKQLLNVGMLIFITACNMISVTAGFVALSPGSQGRAMIARELNPILLTVGTRAAALEGVAANFDALANYSTRRARQESATARSEWQPTCPDSTGPGVGPVTEWRMQSSEQATATSQSLRAAATASRNAAASAERAAAGYSPAAHDQAMATIATAVAGINRTSAQFVAGSSTSFLERLGTETSATGICPDPQMQLFLTDARKVSQAAKFDNLTFVAPEKPSEELAVHDLTEQLAAIATGSSGDLSLYRRYLSIAPLADALFMLLLAQVLPPLLRNYRVETARRLGIRDEDAEMIDEAGAAVAHDLEWTTIQALRRRVSWGPVAFDRVMVHEEDFVLLYKLREYAASGAVREGGPDCNGNIVFILRPHFLGELWCQLLRRHFAAGRPLAVEPITILERA
jgi:hypothetical protein